MLKETLTTFQIIASIGLIILILMQGRGTGFGRGASSASFTRRGLEKLIFRLTFVVVAIFLIVSVSLLFV